MLEIYSSSEREKLRVQEKIFQDLITEGVGSDGDSDGDGEFKTNHTVEFKDQKTLEYQEIIAQGGKLTKLSSATSYHTIYDQISDSDDGDSEDHDHDRDDNARERDREHDNADREYAHAHDEPRVKHSYTQQLEEVDIDDI